MSWFRSETKHLEHPQSILHLGAGACKELDSYQALQPLKIILVEPNPEFLPILRQNSISMKNVYIENCAVSTDEYHNLLNIFNDPDYSSLSKPTGLYELMPGLRQPARVEVGTMTATELVETHSLDQSQNNWLVIDTPGVEADVISDLENAGQLTQFSHIFLRAGQQSFYENATAIDQILTRLKSLGYEQTGDPNQADADWPEYHLHIDKMFLRCRALTLEVEQLKAKKHQLSELTTQIEAEQQEFVALTQKHETCEQELRKTNEINKQLSTKLKSQLNKHQNEIDVLNTQKEAREQEFKQASEISKQINSKLESQLEIRQQEIDALNAQQKTREQEVQQATELNDEQTRTAQTQLQSITAEKDKQLELINKLKGNAEVTAAELEKAQSEIQSLTAAEGKQSQKRTELEELLKEKEKDLAEMKQTNRINNKLLLKTDTDLRDLQLQYRSAMQNQKHQHDLLNELKIKLGQASEFYQKLKLQNNVIDSGKLERDEADSDDPDNGQK